jgi:hypothetical protein
MTMPKYALTINCECEDELAAVIAKLNGACVAKDKPADDEEKPAKKAKKEEPADDEPAPKKKSKQDKIRDALRELAEKTDRKTAVKLLNKYGENVDEVDADQLDELLEKVNEAIEAA